MLHFIVKSQVLNMIHQKILKIMLVTFKQGMWKLVFKIHKRRFFVTGDYYCHKTTGD